MSSSTTIDWRALSQSSFQKWVDGLSGDAFKALVNSDQQFRNRIENKPWDSTPNVRDAAPARAAKEEADRQFKAAVKEFEKQAQALAEEMRDKLKRRLDNGIGLTNDLVKFFLDAPEFKNLPIYSTAGSGGSFTPADRAEIKKAYQTFCTDAKREFTNDERGVLLRTLGDIGGLGKALSPMHARCWKAALLLATTIGRVSHKAAPKAEEPTMAQKIANMVAPKTKADLRREHTTEIVFEHKGKKYTQMDIDACPSDEYRELIRAGYTKDGPLLTNTLELKTGKKLERSN